MTEFVLHSIQREKILEMTREEEKIRYSKEIQRVYTEQYYASKNPDYKIVNIEMEVQKFILRKFGFTDDANSLKEYWKIPSTYWNDEEIKNSIFYMKLNIFQYSEVKLEDNIVDVDVLDYQTGKSLSLASLQTPNKPLVILAGSMT